MKKAKVKHVEIDEFQSCDECGYLGKTEKMRSYKQICTLCPNCMEYAEKVDAVNTSRMRS